MTIHGQQLTLQENDNRQQFCSPATTSSLCVYLCDRSGQRGQVWPGARLGHSKRDRTEQAIFSKPLWLNSLFSHQSPWNCSVCLYERHPDGTVGSKLSKQIAGSLGGEAASERRGSTKVIRGHGKAAEKENLKRPVWVCLVEFWLTCGHTSPAQSGITLTFHLVYVHLLLFTQAKHGRGQVERCCLVDSRRCT